MGLIHSLSLHAAVF